MSQNDMLGTDILKAANDTQPHQFELFPEVLSTTIQAKTDTVTILAFPETITNREHQGPSRSNITDTPSSVTHLHTTIAFSPVGNTVSIQPGIDEKVLESLRLTLKDLSIPETAVQNIAGNKIQSIEELIGTGGFYLSTAYLNIYKKFQSGIK